MSVVLGYCHITPVHVDSYYCHRNIYEQYSYQNHTWTMTNLYDYFKSLRRTCVCFLFGNDLIYSNISRKLWTRYHLTERLLSYSCLTMWHQTSNLFPLIHRCRDQMASILQMTFCFLEWKCFNFNYDFEHDFTQFQIRSHVSNWQNTITVAEQATNHYLKQRWPSWLRPCLVRSKLALDFKIQNPKPVNKQNVTSEFGFS